MTRVRRLVLAVSMMLALVILDQATKEIAIHTLKGHAPIAFPKGWAPNDLFRFQFATNTGAFLSLFSTLDDSIRAWLLIGLNSVILVAVGAILFIV